MRSLRQLLEEFCDKKGFDKGDESLEEVLREFFRVVWEGDEDSRRWRIDYNVVVEIEDGIHLRYFKFSACKGTNDNDWEDAGYRFEGIDKVREVYEKKRVEVFYGYKQTELVNGETK